MKDCWMKKGLVVSVILLFICVAIAPSINQSVVRASQDDDLVEVTTQACGINGFGNTTVKLTREQYQNLEQYLIDFRARLNQTKTREEAVPIFKNAVVELDKYGLLPKGMSVEQVQKLVTRQFHNQKCLDIIWRLLRGNQRSFSDTENWYCLLISVSDCLFIHDFIERHWETIPPGEYSGFVRAIYEQILSIIYRIQPIFFWCHIGFYNLVHDRNGWVNTIGLNGIRSVNGHLDGGIVYYNGLRNETLGATGFTGIKIEFDKFGYFMLGTAFHTNFITPENQY